ncbi:MAG: MATE family efflux transporter [Chromatiales bacterium]|nr:MATE family efflux transporter [Chromatiales bacterium]
MKAKPAARLAEGPVSRSIWSLMLPMMIGMVALLSYNVADTFFVGQLGTPELAAMSFTFPVGFIVGALSMGLGVGTSAVVARLFGSGDRDEIQRITAHAILLGVLVGALVLVAGLLTIEPVFRLLGADDETLPLIERYMRIYYWGGIFMVVPMIANSVLRASGDAIRPARIMTLAALFNIVLDPILIFGLFGMPRLELEGAALATVIANVGTLLAALGLVVFRERLVALDQLAPRLILDSWSRILHIALPSMTSSLVAPMTTAFITWQVAQFGTEAVAGFGMASRIEGLALLVLMSLSAAMTPFTGQNFGAGRLDRVREGMYFAWKISLLYGAGMALLLHVAAPGIAALFTDDEAAREAAVLHLRIVPLGYLALGVAMTVNGALNALGRPVAAMLVSLSRTLLVYAPLAWLLARFFGLPGVFIAAATASAVAGAVGLAWFLHVLRQHERDARAGQ